MIRNVLRRLKSWKKKINIIIWNFELKRKVYYFIFISFILKSISFAGNIEIYIYIYIYIYILLRRQHNFYFVNYIITLLELFTINYFSYTIPLILSGILCNLKVMSEKMCRLKRMLGRGNQGHVCDLSLFTLVFCATVINSYKNE